MFSQEVVSKISDSPKEPAVVSTDASSDWDTAERYYRNGRFQCIASASETVGVEQIASSARADDTPVVFISAIVQAEEPEVPSDQTPLPAATEPVDPPALSPLASASEPIATLPDEVPGTADHEPSVFDALVQEDEPVETEVNVMSQAEAEPQPQPKNGEIDVLPLPLGERAQGVAGFGVFSDKAGAPKSGVSQSDSGVASERQFTQTDPYRVPAGHSMRYVDPKDLVRQRAVEKAENRRRRIEARKWMGYDPLRPNVTAVPYMAVPATHPALVVIPFVVRGDQLR